MNEFISEILATVFICVGVIYLNKQIIVVFDEKQFMTKSLFTILFMMVLLFVADKLFFANRDLLSKEARQNLFSLIHQLLLIMFGYYFGQNKSQ